MIVSGGYCTEPSELGPRIDAHGQEALNLSRAVEVQLVDENAKYCVATAIFFGLNFSVGRLINRFLLSASVADKRVEKKFDCCQDGLFLKVQGAPSAFAWEHWARSRIGAPCIGRPADRPEDLPPNSGATS